MTVLAANTFPNIEEMVKRPSSQNSWLNRLANKVAETGLAFLETNPYGISSAIGLRSNEEPKRPILIDVKGRSWKLELDPEDLQDLQKQQSMLIHSNSSTISPIQQQDQTNQTAQLRKFLLENVQIPAEIVDVFANNIVPPGSLISFTFDPTKKTFIIELNQTYTGNIKTVSENSIKTLNGATVTMPKVISGTYDPEKKSIVFTGKDPTTLQKWIVSGKLTGFSIAGDNTITVLSNLTTLDITFAKFTNTFGSSDLKWSQACNPSSTSSICLP